MKKAISVLLIITTLLGCCVSFFACKPKDEPELTENGGLKNTSTVVLNLENDSTLSKTGLTKSDKVYDLSGASSSAKWEVSKNKILTLDFDNQGLSDYKEISFWMLNDSELNVSFTVYFIMEDGEEIRISGLLYDQHTSYPTYTKVKNMIASPGWNQYKLALSEVEPLEDRSYSYVEPEDKNEEGTIKVKFDKSKIVGIKLDAHNANVLTTKNINFYITSLCGNNVKTGTILGYAIPNIENAVCFYESSNAYLYNQNRYVYDYNDKNVLPGNNNNTTLVPVEVLARHRGAEITANDKENKVITFNYKGKSYTFKEGDEISFVGDERGFSAGVSLKENVVAFGEYLLIPMETAAEIFGYHLYFDQMGLAVFSDTDLKEKYLHSLHENYRTDVEKGMPAIYHIIQVMMLKNYTGAEVIEDMNTIHGEDGHTKILVTQEQFDALRERLETDKLYASWFNRFESERAKGTEAYDASLPVFYVNDGIRMQGMSQNTTDQLIDYAFLYKMTDNEDYAIKVKKLLIAASKFRDNLLTGCRSWHPEHTLDTGIMMLGYAVAYDWCYDYLAKSKKDLKAIEDGMWELGFGAFMGFGELYEWWDDESNINKYNQKMENDEDPGTTRFLGSSLGGHLFYTSDGAKYKKYNFEYYPWMNNWGSICLGGVLPSALAFANVNTEFRAASEYLIDCVLFALPCTLYAGFAPDGGYPEGLGYWSAGSYYTLVIEGSFNTAIGSGIGYFNAPGFRESYYFVNALSSSSGDIWNFHDAVESRSTSYTFFFYANYSGDKGIAGIRYNFISSGKEDLKVWDLMFYNPDSISKDVQIDLDYCYYGIATATFRSDWTDNSMFCGLHGGANGASHGQLDIGNFILEYGGTRFFRDLGRDGYNIQGYNDTVDYFTQPYRYWYYRSRAEGHNTLIINPTKVDTNNRVAKNQGRNYDSDIYAVSDILRFESGKTSALAVIDMACAYYDSVPVYYACSSCEYETPGICTSSRCDGKGNQMALEFDSASRKYVLKCVASGCTATIDAVCERCGGTLVEKRNGIRGMYVRENRTTVVIQDEMWLTAPATRVYWMGHVAEGAKVTVSDDMQSALVQLDGKTLLVQIVVPDGYTGTWRFETQAADYLPETGLVMVPGEMPRDGMQKLVAISEGTSEIKLAIVCKLLSAGPHSYTWTDIEDWTVDR